MLLVLMCIYIAEKLNQIQLAYIRDVENKYKCIIIDKTTKHQQETEVYVTTMTKHHFN